MYPFMAIWEHLKKNVKSEEGEDPIESRLKELMQTRERILSDPDHSPHDYRLHPEFEHQIKTGEGVFPYKTIGPYIKPIEASCSDCCYFNCVKTTVEENYVKTETKVMKCKHPAIGGLSIKSVDHTPAFCPYIDDYLERRVIGFKHRTEKY